MSVGGSFASRIYDNEFWSRVEGFFFCILAEHNILHVVSNALVKYLLLFVQLLLVYFEQ